MGIQTQILAFKATTLKGRAFAGPYLEHGVHCMTDTNCDRASLSPDNDQIFTQARSLATGRLSPRCSTETLARRSKRAGAPRAKRQRTQPRMEHEAMRSGERIAIHWMGGENPVDRVRLSADNAREPRQMPHTVRLSLAFNLREINTTAWLEFAALRRYLVMS